MGILLGTSVIIGGTTDQAVPGEHQVTVNFSRALSDYMTNFVFGKGVTWKVPPENEAIITPALSRIWEVDNDKEKVVWEIGQYGSICGDVFAKVAYEESWKDPVGNFHPGRVRILPLNPATCFPVEENEALTQRGWLRADDVVVGDKVLSIDPVTNARVWADVKAVNIYDWDGPLYEMRSKNFSAACTPDHRWVVDTGYKGQRKVKTTDEIARHKYGSLVLAGGKAANFPDRPFFSDEFIQLVGWTAAEGWDDVSHSVQLWQSEKNQKFCDAIDLMADKFRAHGHVVTKSAREGGWYWYFPSRLGREVWKWIDTDKGIDPKFLTRLTQHQAQLLYDTILDGDGDTQRLGGRERLYQDRWGLLDSFQMLAMMLGKRSIAKLKPSQRDKFGDFDGTVGVHQSTTANLKWVQMSTRHYKGRVWCPTTSTGTWVTRRVEEVRPNNGNSIETDSSGSWFRKTVYLTGNCFPEW